MGSVKCLQAFELRRDEIKSERPGQSGGCCSIIGAWDISKENAASVNAETGNELFGNRLHARKPVIIDRWIRLLEGLVTCCGPAEPPFARFSLSIEGDGIAAQRRLPGADDLMRCLPSALRIISHPRIEPVHYVVSGLRFVI